MEHISNILDQVTNEIVKAPEPNNTLTNYDRQKEISDPENRMLQLKYSGPRLFHIPSVDRPKVCRILLIKIHVITGWVIPDDERNKILADQFEKKLMENYSDLNVDEIEYAFRNGGTVIEDWGKEMNLNLLDKVLIPYRDKRKDVSDKEERNAEPPPQKIFTQEELDDGARSDVEAQYQYFLRGHELKGTQFNRSILLKDKLLGEQETTMEFFKRWAEKGLPHIYVKE